MGLDTVSNAKRELIEAVTFPMIWTQAGGAKRVADAKRKQQLEALGYR